MAFQTDFTTASQFQVVTSLSFLILDWLINWSHLNSAAVISANKDAIGHKVWRRMRNNNCAVAIALWLKKFIGRLQKPLKSQGHFVGNSGLRKPYLLKRLTNKVNAVFSAKGENRSVRSKPPGEGNMQTLTKSVTRTLDLLAKSESSVYYLE